VPFFEGLIWMLAIHLRTFVDRDEASPMQGGQPEQSSGKMSFLRGNMLVMIATGAVWQFVGNSVWPFFSLYVLALQGTPEMIGIISGIGTIASIPPAIIGGYLADIYGRKKLTAFFSMILGLTSLLMAIAFDWRMLLIAVIIDSFAAGLREPAMSALIADSLSPESRGIGFLAWGIVTTVPSIFSPMIAGYMIDQLGALLTIRWGYALTGLAALTAGSCRYLFLSETVRPRPGEARSVSKMTRAMMGTYRQMSRDLWILLISEGLVWLGWAAASPYFILYGTTDVIGLTTTEWGLVLLGSSSVRVLGFVFGSLADRYGRRNMIVAMLLLAGGSSFFFLYLEALPQVALVFAVYSLSILVNQQMSQALRADVCPREDRSRVYSFFVLWQFATRTAGSILGGLLYVSVSKTSPFYFQTFAMLICAIVLAFMITEKARREK